MSVPMAVSRFSEQDEQQMRINGDESCADLCQDIRNWWVSEDKAGIPALQRINLREELKTQLLDCIHFEKIPPATMNINGWHLQLWLGLVS